ncbi:MAG: response regulator, partial [Anaerolineae bacterium]|nr:response regulator [Anaerolineae bacterium]
MPHALIIDDNLQNVKVLAQLLAKQGVKCTEILSPTQIVDNPVQDEPIDVIFLDLEMPTIDGYQLKEML